MRQRSDLAKDSSKGVIKDIRRMSSDVRARAVTLALDEPELLPRKPAVCLADSERYFFSENSVSHLVSGLQKGWKNSILTVVRELPRESRFMRLTFTIAATLLCLGGVQAQAQSTDLLHAPATLGFSAGYFELRPNNKNNEAVDFRLEYRSSYDMLSLTNSRSSWLEIRPMGGVEMTSDGAFYGFGGFVFDIPLGKHFVLSPNEAVGYWNNGRGINLGSAIEFRSTIELAYRFDDESRLGVAFGHISNAGIQVSSSDLATGNRKINPGVEIVSLYYHVPLENFLSR
jgi:lipid A 3-O-deacylase